MGKLARYTGRIILEKIKNLYVFGNEFVEGDNFANEVAKFIRKAKVIHCTHPDSLLEVVEDEIIILDVVRNIMEPMVIEDVSHLKSNKIISLHDFDLGFFLKLMQKIKLDKKIKIIGIPQEGDAKKISKKVEALL